MEASPGLTQDVLQAFACKTKAASGTTASAKTVSSVKTVSSAATVRGAENMPMPLGEFERRRNHNAKTASGRSRSATQLIHADLVTTENKRSFTNYTPEEIQGASGYGAGHTHPDADERKSKVANQIARIRAQATARVKDRKQKEILQLRAKDFEVVE